MFGVSNYDSAVVELDFETWPLVHDAGSSEHTGWLAISSDEIVADLDFSHRRPAAWCWQRRVQRKGLAQGRPCSDHDHLAGMQAVGERVEIGEPGGHASAALSPTTTSAPGMISDSAR